MLGASALEESMERPGTLSAAASTPSAIRDAERDRDRVAKPAGRLEESKGRETKGGLCFL